MGMLYECGAFTWPNTTASQTINLANSSLTPIAVIFWTKGPGAAGFTAGAKFSIGFGTRRGGSTQAYCLGLISIDNVSTSDTAKVRNNTLLHVLSSTSATDYTIALDSFGAGTIGVTASSGTNANGDTIYYCAFGGSDLTDANVLEWTMDATSGGEAITGVGFMPSVVFGLALNGSAALGTIVSTMNCGFGFASSSTKFAGWSVFADDNDTMTSNMQWGKSQHSTGFLAQHVSVDGTVDALWDLDSFDSDGATLGVVNAPAVTTSISGFLFIKGGIWEAGLAAKDTDTGVDDFALANGTLTPLGALLFAIGATAEGLTSANHDFCMGSTDGTHEGAFGITGAEAINTATDALLVTDRCIEELTGNTPTETSEADFSAFSAGNLQINWAVNGGAANLVGYLAFGSEPAAVPNLVEPILQATKRAAFW